MRLRFLGTGTSYGVPYIGCDCAVCRSDDARDKRLRASILVEDDATSADGEDEATANGVTTRLIVDTGPDFRVQMLRAGVNFLSAILWTHAHNDHIIGLDDIRPLSDHQGYVPAYGDAHTIGRISGVFDYCFIQGRDHGGFPRVTPHIVAPFQSLHFGPIRVTPLPISHGRAGDILAYEFESAGRRAVYASDCAHIPDDSLERMKGCDVFIVDALRHTAHPNHFNIEQALEAIEKIAPTRAFFTHLTHDLPHEATENSLPARVKLAYDGLVLEI